MIGAIIGDVVGSRFEFNNIKTKKFELLTEQSVFTDDTVLTIAVLDWCLNSKDKSDDKEAIYYLQKWAKKYPNAGYGGMFYRWKDKEIPKPYYSCGNGSAMRISPVAWAFEDKEEMLRAVRTITSITHNHPEGIKGAEVTAMLIYLARQGATKAELKEYALKEYPEIKELKYEELVKTYSHGPEICQLTVPQAVYCFLISESFEDCLRTTISIGGDCDTTSAISCAIAEAFYEGIPLTLMYGVKSKLSEEMNVLLNCFEKKYIRGEKIC